MKVIKDIKNWIARNDLSLNEAFRVMDVNFDGFLTK